MSVLLPLRSLLRNRRRSLLSLAIVGLGSAIAVFVLGYVQESRALIRQTSVDEYGNLQIAAPSLWDGDAEGYEYLIPPQTLVRIEDRLAADPRVVASTAQLQFPGLLAAGDQTQVVRVTGIVPGNPALPGPQEVSVGRGLDPGDNAAVLMGQALADRLGVSAGSVVTLTLTTVDGAYNASPLEIVGVFRFASEQVELQTLFLPLRYAQALLNTAGVDRVVLTLDRVSATWATRARLQATLDADALLLEARTWDELSPFYQQLSNLFDILFGFIALATAVLVFFIILQVLTLSFLERTREVGTVRALGVTRGGVFSMLLAEGGWLAVIGSAAGVGVGVLLSLVFNAVGIEWTPPGTVEPVTLAVSIGLSTALAPFLLGAAAAFLSAVLPASRMSRLTVVDALRVE